MYCSIQTPSRERQRRTYLIQSNTGQTQCYFDPASQQFSDNMSLKLALSERDKLFPPNKRRELLENEGWSEHAKLSFSEPRRLVRIARILRARLETLEALGQNDLFDLPLPTTAEEYGAVELLQHSVAQKSTPES